MAQRFPGVWELFSLVPSKGCPAQDKWKLITKGLSSEASATWTWQAQAICMKALSSLWERQEGRAVHFTSASQGAGERGNGEIGVTLPWQQSFRASRGIGRQGSEKLLEQKAVMGYSKGDRFRPLKMPALAWIPSPSLSLCRERKGLAGMQTVQRG